MAIISKSYLSKSIILQTLQQLRDVYGDSVDKIVQGNAQPLTAKIATPMGWKSMGDIKVGDSVLTPYGGITEVSGVYPQGVRPVYKVTLRDGSTTEACDEHLWEVERYKSAIRYTGVVRDGKRQYVGTNDGKTCELITETITTDVLKARVDKGRQINLPKIKPLQYEEQDLEIHPYVLGMLIGDAHIDYKGSAYLTCNDEEALNRIRSYGYELTLALNGSYYVKGVSKYLREFKLDGVLSYDKFVPKKYLLGSVQQRINLLRGLMDSDGYISEMSEIEFVSTSERLAIDVQMLVRSLGGRVSINYKEEVFYTSPNQKVRKQARPAYRVQNIRLYDINPFYLSRKCERWLSRKDNSGNRVVSVEYVRDDVVQCIRVVDEKHLYITDDFIPTHNTSNIVFLKSTDDSMLDTLSKMSGVTHRTYTDGKTVTRDLEKLWLKNEGKVAYNSSTKEEPVIKYNDLAYIDERNSILFRAGDPPIWNRNETILPMSHRLFRNTITAPGKKFTLQTVPTLSTALDFDIRKNQPDFSKMLQKRMSQAMKAQESMDVYQHVYGYTDHEIEQLDPDVYADDILDMINRAIRVDLTGEEDGDVSKGEGAPEFEDMMQFAQDNEAQFLANEEAGIKYKKVSEKIYAGGNVAREDLVGISGGINKNLEKVLSESYHKCRNHMNKDDAHFVYKNGGLYGLDDKLYIQEMANDNDVVSYIIEDAFYRYLVSLDSWKKIADGKFDENVKRHIVQGS